MVAAAAAVAEALEPRRLLSAAPLDLNTITPSSDPSPVRVAGGVGYFTAVTAATGRELWRTDGTEAGTVQVAELAPGTATLNPALLQPVGGRMLLLAGASTSQLTQLWVTDGSAGGTAQVATLPGTVYASATTGAVAFAVVQGPSTAELWRSDGTAGGTYKLTGLSSTAVTLTVAGGYVFFANTDATAGSELWRSDGSVAGTARVADVRAGTGGSSPSQITAVGSRVFFMANDGVNGTELWRSDGTAANTARVTNLEPGSTSAVVTGMTGGTSLVYFVFHNNVWRSDGTAGNTVAVTSYPTTPALNYSLVTVGDRAYFGLLSTASVPEMWTTDGTAAAPSRVWSAPGTGWYHQPYHLLAVGGRVYFREDTYVGNDTLYATDGTPGGTRAVMTYPLLPASNAADSFADLGGAAVFPAKSVVTADVELYRTDGTAAGTRRVKDVNDTPTVSSVPVDAVAVGDRAFFWATTNDVTDGQVGIWLYATDGTAAGTRRLVRTELIGASLQESPIVAWRGRAYFMSDSDGLGRELWTSDGTVEGTRPVADLSPGAAATMIEMLYPTDDYLYFAATTSASGRELWRTDGTAGGTVMVRDMNPGTGNGIWFDPHYAWPITQVGGVVYFYGWDNPNTVHLFRTDGTDAGTVQLGNLGPDIFRKPPHSNFAEVGGRLIARMPYDAELWVSDGTPAGTHILKDIWPGTSTTGSDPDWFTSFGGRLFFVATSPDAGRELWVTDGTPEGTTLVKDVNPGTAGSAPANLVVAGDELFFAADDGVHGREWWKTDGTAAGTVLVTDLTPGAQGTTVALGDWGAQTVGGVLVFVARAPDEKQFFRSDGTAEGTYALTALPAKFFLDGPSDGTYLGRAQGYLYYALASSAYGREVWRTDGTAAGTGPVADVTPGSGGSNPMQFAAFGTSAMFAGDSPTIGREPWFVTDDAPPVVTRAEYAPGGGAGPGVTIRFNEALAGPLSAGGLTVTDADTGAVVPAGGLSVVLDAASGILTLRPAAGGRLADGNYRVTLAGGAVTDTAGNAFAGGYTFDFYVLAGDANRDRVVNFADLLALAKNYNKSGATWADGDFTGDGVVNFADLLILAKAYNKALPAAAPAPAVAPAAAAVTTNAVLAGDGEAKGKPVFSTTAVAKAAPKPAPVKPKAVAKAKGR